MHRVDRKEQNLTEQIKSVLFDFRGQLLIDMWAYKGHKK